MSKVLLIKSTEASALQWAIRKGIELTKSDKKYDQLSNIDERLNAMEALTFDDVSDIRDYLKAYQTTEFEKNMLSKLNYFLTQQKTI